MRDRRRRVGVDAEKQQRYPQLIAQGVSNRRRASWLGSIPRRGPLAGRAVGPEFRRGSS